MAKCTLRLVFFKKSTKILMQRINRKYLIRPCSLDQGHNLAADLLGGD